MKNKKKTLRNIFAIFTVLTVAGLLFVADIGSIGASGSGGGTGGPTEISTWAELSEIRETPSGNYILTADLNENTEGYDDFVGENANEGLGWEPIGSEAVAATGKITVVSNHVNGAEITFSLPGEGTGGDVIVLTEGQEWSRGFNLGATASNISTAINDDETLSEHVEATRTSNFVSIEAWDPGEGGNDISISTSHPTNLEIEDMDGGINEALFTGTFDGNGHTISGLNIDRPEGSGVGLFGYMGGEANVLNVKLEDMSITGGEAVGGIVGNNDGGTISNSYSTGTVTGEFGAGGLVGSNEGEISSSYSTALVEGVFGVGGLVGFNGGAITNSHSTGTVTGEGSVGGFVGGNNWGEISSSYSTGVVIGENMEEESFVHLGGFVGDNYIGTVSNSYSTGDVTGRIGTTGTLNIGGFVGGDNEGEIINSYSTGAVGYEGGAYATVNIGGFLGHVINESWPGTFTANYWNTDTSGISEREEEDGATGKTTEQMTYEGYENAGTYDNWDFTEIWGIHASLNDGYPYLSWQEFKHTLSYTSGDGGGIEVNETIYEDFQMVVNEGEDGTGVKAVPNEGYYFLGWNDENTDNPRTDTAVTENISVTAVFAETPVASDIEATVDEGNGIVIIEFNSNIEAHSRVLFGMDKNNLVRSTDKTIGTMEEHGHDITFDELFLCGKSYYRIELDDDNGVEGESVTLTGVNSFDMPCEEGQYEPEKQKAKTISNAIGGEVNFSERGVNLNIPPGFFNKPATFRAATLNREAVTISTPVSKESAIDHFFQFNAIDEDNNSKIESFLVPVEIEVELPAGVLKNFDLDTVCFSRWDPLGETWENIENCVVDEVANKVTVELDGFSIYGLFGSRPAVASATRGGAFFFFDEETPETDMPAEKPIFTDTEGHWGKDYIDELRDKCGIIGYSDEEGSLLNLFGPNNTVTRAELVRMIVGCEMEEEPETLDNLFSDVEAGKWYAPYISYARAAGKIEGYEDGTFKPNNEINRVEALKVILLSRYTEEEISEFSSEQFTHFEDTKSGKWYSKFLKFAAVKGFVSGYTDEEGIQTGYFGPANTLTRAEAAKVIIEVLKNN